MKLQLDEIRDFAKKRRGNRALLARESGVSKYTVTRIVAGDSDTRVSNVSKVYDALLRVSGGSGLKDDTKE